MDETVLYTGWYLMYPGMVYNTGIIILYVYHSAALAGLQILLLA